MCYKSVLLIYKGGLRPENRRGFVQAYWTLQHHNINTADSVLWPNWQYFYFNLGKMCLWCCFFFHLADQTICMNRYLYYAKKMFSVNFPCVKVEAVMILWMCLFINSALTLFFCRKVSSPQIHLKSRWRTRPSSRNFR